MITLEQYFMDRDKRYVCDPQVKVNAMILLPKVNALLDMYTASTDNVVSIVNSGWRPAALNACVPNASHTSLHITGQAIDLQDSDELLDEWLMTPQGQYSLMQCELWHELPASTVSWCHLQSLPFHSYVSGGTRTFHP